MAQGGGSVRRRTATKSAKKKVHHKKARTALGSVRKPKHIVRSNATKQINQGIERLTASRVSRAGKKLEMSALENAKN